jgi:hypothetical protein
MGMFSTVLYEDKEIQFKTGYDDCFTYKVGDTIDWVPDPYRPGEDINGIHSGCYDVNGPDYWVVVKDCVIVAVEPPGQSYGYLTTKYKIPKPNPKLWTKKQWKDRAKREAKGKAEYAAWAKLHGDDPIGYYMHCKLNEKSCIDQILPAIKVK